jgi:polar amino acid transport system substrate-binding protein
MRTLKRILLAVGLTLFCLTAVAEAPPLVLAFSPLPPWRVVDAQGKPSGPYLDIMQLLARRVHLPLVVHVCPLLRCMEMLRRGDADLAIGVAPGAGREEFVDFLRPAFAEGSAVGFYRRRGAKVSAGHYSDLSTLRIGTTIGALYFPRFDQDASLQKDYAPDKPSNLRKLLAGRVDLVIMVQGEAHVMQSQPEFAHRIELAGEPVITGPRNIVLSRASHGYVHKAQLEAALHQMVSSGEVRHLLHPVEH